MARSGRATGASTQVEPIEPILYQERAHAPTDPAGSHRVARRAAGACQPALAEVDVLSMSSDARFTSVLKAPPPWSSAYSVASASEWIALGRHAKTATPAGQPVGSPFSVDNVQAWADFQQEDEGSSFHSYARLTGNYLDAGPWNFARNEIWLTNRYLVEYDAWTGPRIKFNVTHASHGLLLAGGIASNLRARAEEQVFWGLRVPLPGLAKPYLLKDAWFGSAEVTPDGPPTATDDWRTRWFTTSREFDYGVLDGMELSVLLVGKPITMDLGDTLWLDVIFHGIYEVRGTADTGYFSAALADFSHSGALSFQAIDTDTGLPADGLKFTLLSPVPTVSEPSAIAMLGLGLALLAGWRANAGQGARYGCRSMPPPAHRQGWVLRDLWSSWLARTHQQKPLPLTQTHSPAQT
ncbi:MAG: hypothetical protein AW06_004143 [Candidatus Accumulibacter cognatus]|uniref:PEP-CTERM protein-sorting domain-containing protein n=1 Tax=Candidatus Accumulibacter cognatus TaxID=2954383 RepID=A0A080M3E2_9PROT|nr:MAG: hypothetical protein AW06_004143 [Candidatus Accumulibacter cognatus]